MRETKLSANAIYILCECGSNDPAFGLGKTRGNHLPKVDKMGVALFLRKTCRAQIADESGLGFFLKPRVHLKIQATRKTCRIRTRGADRLIARNKLNSRIILGVDQKGLCQKPVLVAPGNELGLTKGVSLAMGRFGGAFPESGLCLQVALETYSFFSGGLVWLV